LSDGKPVIQVSKSDIKSIELKRAIGAERPLPQFIFGLLLTVPGWYFSRALWFWLFSGGRLVVDVTFWSIAMIPLGLWLAISAFRKRTILHVHMRNDHRKILFQTANTSAEIKAFVRRAQEQFGYCVTDSLPG